MSLLHSMNILLQCSQELPDPARPLSSSLLSLAIEEINVPVASAHQQEVVKAERGLYLKMGNETRAKFSRCCNLILLCWWMCAKINLAKMSHNTKRARLSQKFPLYSKW